MTTATSAAPTRPAPQRSQQARRRLDVAAARRRLQALADQPDLDHDAALAEVVDVAAELTGALGVAYLRRDESQRLTADPRFFAPHHLGQLKSVVQTMLRLATTACAEGAPQAATVPSDDKLLVVALPVQDGPSGDEAIAVAVGMDAPGNARRTSVYLTQLLVWMTAFSGSLRPTSGRSRSAVAIAAAEAPSWLPRWQEMLEKAAAKSRLRDAANEIAQWLRDETGSPIVAIGLRGRRRNACRLVGCSGVPEFDARSSMAGQLRDVLDETTIAVEVEVEVGAREAVDEQLLDTSTLRELRRSTGLHVSARYGLRDGSGATLGAVLLLREESSERSQADEDRAIPQPALRLLGTSLALMRDAEPSWLSRTLGLAGTQSAWYRRRALWGCLAAVALLMLIPLPLQVRCPCVVQPRHRRFVAVPYEGRLQEALTEPGELVQQGQLLARMDGREIEWELAGVTADLRRVEKERDTALAAYDTAAAQMAALETQRLQLRADLLRDRLHNLEVRSPVDGIVIGGDPRKLEGARLSMGQTIFEVGPLDRMVVELEIADEDVSHVTRGQRTVYRLAALPWQKFAAEITRIQPRSESRHNANVFVAEIDVANTDLAMRPGMQGRARIEGPWHPLGWNLFHKAWDAFWTRVAW